MYCLGVYRDMVQANLYGTISHAYSPSLVTWQNAKEAQTNGFRQVPANAYTPAQATYKTHGSLFMERSMMPTILLKCYNYVSMNFLKKTVH